jgi:hypothetical protein
MTQGTGWQEPLTPWQIVLKRFFGGEQPDPTAFAEKYGLDKDEVRRVFSGETATLSPGICIAFSGETGMSIRFFERLSEQPQAAA